MPMVIPLIAAYAAGAAAATAIAAGTLTTLGTIAAYATIAGSVLTGVGALTGSKDLMKIGAVLSIGGGIGTIAGSAGEAAVQEAAAASDAGGGSIAASSAGDAASTAANAAPIAQAPQVAAPGTPDPTAVASPVNPGGPVQTTPLAGDALQAPSTSAIDPLTGVATGATEPAQAAGTPLMDKAGILGSQGVQPPDPSAINPDVANYSKPVAPTAVQQAGSKMTSSDLSSWFEKAKSAGGAVAEFMQKNPALTKIGGEMLTSMYGPAAEKFDYEKSLMDRARANLNAPVQMRYVKPGA